MSFLFRKNYLTACSLIQDNNIRLALYDKICRFGVTGDENSTLEDQLTPKQKLTVEMIARPIINSIKNSQDRYRLSQELGRKGGINSGKSRRNKANSSNNEE